jgi:hypothetical protein
MSGAAFAEIPDGTVRPSISARIDPATQGQRTAFCCGEKDALIRGTIKTQLEAAQWPDFAEVKPAQ